MPCAAANTTHTLSGLPCGRRSPRGRSRWYLLEVPKGREESIAEELRKLVPAPLLTDVFAMKREFWVKRAGAWRLQTKIAYPGYLFAVSSDPAGLDGALSALTLPVRLAGPEGRSWAPLSRSAEEWFRSAVDSNHVLRGSTGTLEGGHLRVHSGPLRGQEARLRDLDRHHRRCMVDIPDADGGFSELMALEIPLAS